jgi:hypothetical protein
MLDWDINHYLLQNFNEIFFQILTMMHEIWIGIKNYKIVIVFCVHCSMQTPS